jgi:hypothetical protein
MIHYKFQQGWDAALINDSSQSLSDTLLNTESAKFMITKAIDNFDSDGSLRGLFSALDLAKHRISPFIAARDYCIKIIDCTREGGVIINISPIYLLGPDYPAEYKNKHGVELADDAIIGLTDISNGNEHHTFHMGIDAGIVFKNSDIVHNRQLTLNLTKADKGIISVLSCESQTTSKLFKHSEFDNELANFTLPAEAVA